MSKGNEKVTELLTNATSGNGVRQPHPASTKFTVEVEWGVGTTAGSVVIETGPHKDYTGTWSNKTTFAWAAADSVDEWRGDGPFGALRVRIVSLTTNDKGITARVREA